MLIVPIIKTSMCQGDRISDVSILIISKANATKINFKKFILFIFLLNVNLADPIYDTITPVIYAIVIEVILPYLNNFDSIKIINR